MGRRGRILVLAMAMLPAAAGAQAAAMRVCAADWPPFTVAAGGEPSGPPSGPHAARVIAVLADLGYEAAIHVVSWQRCLKDLAEGYYAVAYPADYRREREAFAVYSRVPLDLLRYVAVVRRDEAPGWRGGDLAGLPQPIAVRRGWALLEDLRATPGITLDDGSLTPEQDIRKLLAGRIGTAVLEARTAVALLARHDPQGKLAVLGGPPLGERPVYLLFSRKALGNRGAQALSERVSARLAAVGRNP